MEKIKWGGRDGNGTYVCKTTARYGKVQDSSYAIIEDTRRKHRMTLEKTYQAAVKLRNHANSQRVLDSKTEEKMDILQNQLIREVRKLYPEQAINLETLNQYDASQLPPTCLQDPKRTMQFSEVLKRVRIILKHNK